VVDAFSSTCLTGTWGLVGLTAPDAAAAAAAAAHLARGHVVALCCILDGLVHLLLLKLDVCSMHKTAQTTMLHVGYDNVTEKMTV
jgi:hypothetical protein